MSQEAPIMKNVKMHLIYQVHIGNRKYYYTDSGILDSDWSIGVLSSPTFCMMTAVLYTVF